jgi:hypothetical protein
MPQNIVNENSLVTVPHPPYSPDLAPSDFWLSGHIKASLAGRVFNDVSELLEGSSNFSMRFIPLNRSLFSPLHRTSETGLRQ